MHSQVCCSRQKSVVVDRIIKTPNAYLKSFALLRRSSLGIKAVALRALRFSELLKAPHLDECFFKKIY